MALKDTPQPEIIEISDSIRLRRYDGNFGLFLPGPCRPGDAPLRRLLDSVLPQQTGNDGFLFLFSRNTGSWSQLAGGGIFLAGNLRQEPADAPCRYCPGHRAYRDTSGAQERSVREEAIAARYRQS